MNSIESFLSKINIKMNNGCLFWNASKNNNGYGIFKVDGKTRSAHKWIYEYSEGLIPAGKVLDHICRNRQCVNTAHLRVVTHRQNSIENSLSQSAINMGKTRCVNGHELTEGNLYPDKRGWRRCKRCQCDRMNKRYALWKKEHPGKQTANWSTKKGEG
jgi:hypothetical protein